MQKNAHMRSRKRKRLTQYILISSKMPKYAKILDNNSDVSQGSDYDPYEYSSYSQESESSFLSTIEIYKEKCKLEQTTKSTSKSRSKSRSKLRSKLRSKSTNKSKPNSKSNGQSKIVRELTIIQQFSSIQSKLESIRKNQLDQAIRFENFQTLFCSNHNKSIEFKSSDQAVK